MKALLLQIVFLFAYNLCEAQRLSFDELEQHLNSSLNKAQENLFLKGYSFLGKDSLKGTNTSVYNFSTRGKTIATAKSLSKTVSPEETSKSYIQYVTYEASEFYKLRKLMIEFEFTRSETDSISEVSNYYKDNLEVKFETDNLNKKRAFIVTLRNRNAVINNKVIKKMNLKNLLNRNISRSVEAEK